MASDPRSTERPSVREADIVVIGAGAAGLAAAIAAGEAARTIAAAQPDYVIPRIVILEGARKPGAKILVSGGGRCNVTHAKVTPEDFCGGPRPTIRNVLRAFDEQATIEWMAALGVRLKLEDTDKYFPVSDQARTVLDALLRRVSELQIESHGGARVCDFRRLAEGSPSAVRFEIDVQRGDASAATNPASETWRARRVIVATGGLALPKSGSDGVGFAWMERLGHTLIPRTPALVALLLRSGPGAGGRFAEFSGLSFEARLALYEGGKEIAARNGSMLLTHFGISGPAAMDISRHWLRAKLERPHADLELCLGHPRWPTTEAADAWLRESAKRTPRRAVISMLVDHYPERWARALASSTDAQPAHPTAKNINFDIADWPIVQVPRERRMVLAQTLTRLPLHVDRDRGYAFAEATAGGVNLREIDARTMESRVVPGLYLCGEILDVDGYIGGFNFQWAWSSGHVAGRAAVKG